MDEKKVELTDEEIAVEIVTALKNTKKTLEDLHEDDDDYDKLSLVKKINNSSLWLIKRLLEGNGKQKAEIERLNKCVMSEEQVRKCCADIIQETRQQAVKDTAKEILTKMLTNAKRLKEQFNSTTYGKNREHLIATIEIEIEGIKNLTKRYGVEVIE